jgi:hypothetical protein
MGYKGSVVFLQFESQDAPSLVRVRVKLDFAEERLVFDHFNGMEFVDTGTPEAAEAIAELRRFSMEHFGNGQLQICNAQTGALISRKDAYIPVNIRLDHEAAKAEIADWKQLADRRREWDRLSAEITQRSRPYDVRLDVSFNVQQWMHVPSR